MPVNPAGAGNSNKNSMIGRPFPKGVSGNPSGRPKGMTKARELIDRDGPEVHAKLMELVREGNPQAIIYLHQQWAGRAREQPDENSPSSILIDMPKLTREDLDRFLSAPALVEPEVETPNDDE